MWHKQISYKTEWQSYRSDEIAEEEKKYLRGVINLVYIVIYQSIILNKRSNA